MICHATILHVSAGRRYPERLEVTFLMHRPDGRDLQIDDGYLWTADQDGASLVHGQLVGSVLLAALKSGETVRMTCEDHELFGHQITGVDTVHIAEAS